MYNVHTHRPQAVYFRALRAHIYAYCRQVGLLSGAKHTCTCPPAAGLSTLGREVSVYMPQALAPKRLVKDIRISQLFYRHTITTHAQRQQAGLLSSAKRPFICPSAADNDTCPTVAGRFTFERKAPVYMPISSRQVYFRV